MDPWKRLAEFERAYRAGLDGEEYYNYASEYSGAALLTFPTYRRMAASWQYVFAARDFEAVKEDGGAARAYWGALSLARTAIGSRPDRDQVRKAAYLGLAGIAKRRDQARWAELLTFCAELIEVYLQSPEAKTNSQEFYAFVEKVRAQIQAQQAAQAAQEQQEAAAFFEQLGNMAQAANAQYQGDTQTALQLTTESLVEQLELSSEWDATRDALNDAGAQLGERIKDFEGVVADDVAEVEAGNSFAAAETVFMLSTADDVEPYLEVIESFAAKRPGVQGALAAYKELGKRQGLLKIGKAVQDEEVFVARYERRGEAPPEQAPDPGPVPGAGGAWPAPGAPGIETGGAIASAYEVVLGLEPDGRTSFRGQVRMAQLQGVYLVRWDLENQPSYAGIGILDAGNLFVGWAFGPSYRLMLYEIVAPGNLVGKTVTSEAPDMLGDEELVGPASLNGRFQVRVGRQPGTGRPYVGSVTLQTTGATVRGTWQLGAESFAGVGLRVGDRIAFGCAPGQAGAGVTVYEVDGRELHGRWSVTSGGGKLGVEELRAR